ncbi:hypothetical protein ACHAXR_001353 [Thalassiosira sp. AJA248-18]
MTLKIHHAMFQQLMILLLALLGKSATAYISIITGANGFVGRHVVYSLLQQRDEGADQKSNDPSEQTIICLVRPDKVPIEESYWNAHLMDMQQSSQRKDESCCVKVMSYDMLDNGETLNDALETAVRNIDSSKKCPICIYHIASVFGPTPDPIQTAKDNVQSAEDVVRTLDKFYQRHPNSKPRLVLTSSMAAVRATDQRPINGEYYTHLDWNTLSKLNAENWGACYQWSKAESERRAWELVKECNDKYAKEDRKKARQIEMVALCPSFVFGPPPPMPSKMKDFTKLTTGSSSSYSLTLINQWLQGKSPVQSRLCADVRDVAKAHLAAGTLSELPEADADRRYILSTEERLSSESTAQALIRGVERAQKKNGGNISVDMSSITCDTQFTGGAIKIGDRALGDWNVTSV